jgi:hypothetical protein
MGVDLSAIVTIISGLIKVGLAMYENMKKNPPEERAARLVEYKAAFKKAEETKDLSELSKLFGKGL